MVGQPILNIDKFAGSGESGILFNEGFYPEIDNGKSVMGEGFSNSTLINTSTTGYSNLGTIMSILGLSTIFSKAKYSLLLNATNKFFTNGLPSKEIHTNSQTATAYPCMVETYNGNILYTAKNKIGRGFRGKVTSGSTTTLVDNTASRDFVVEGYAAGDKVTNLTTGIEYTLTVVAATTLTFVANGTNTNSANDEYIVWEDDKLDITITAQNWQPAIETWNKQIKQYGAQYLFGNGNYLGMISASETVVDTTYHQLPYKHQLLAFDINVSMVLVSAEFNGKGVLCLWDGYSDGWNNILELDSPVKAVLKYESGWVYILNGVVYYTDGFQITKLSSLNSNSILDQYNINPAMYNSLTLYRGFLYCAAITGSSFNFLRTGVYVIDLDNTNRGFTVIKCKKLTRNEGIPYSLFLTTLSTDFQQILVGGEGFVDYLRNTADVQYSNKSLLMYINLPQYTKISGIGLNLERYLKDYNNDTSALSRQVQVAIGDGNRGLISRINGTGVTTDTLTVNGTTYLNNEVGDEIIIAQTGDDTYDERSFITSIVDKGTSTEDWTISPALSDVIDTSSEIRMMRLKKCDSITVNYNDLKKEYWFASSGIETNKLFIEIVFYGQDNAMPLNITNIKVYGN
jgi:hypothetical protein